MNFVLKSNNDVLSLNGIFYLIKSDISFLPCSIKANLENAIENKSFKLSVGSARTYYLTEEDIVVVGVGEKHKCANSELDDLRKAINKVMQICISEKYTNISIELRESNIEKALVYKVIAEMATFNSYSFDKFKTDKKPLLLENIYIIDSNHIDNAMQFIEEGKLIGENVNHTRYLVNEPAMYMYPEILANYADELCSKSGIEVDIKGKKEITELGMGAFLAVSKGSDKEPKLIIMRYKGNPESEEILGLVVKGITYDSGGLSIKPTNGMVDMKCDMAGAAAVIGAINLIAKAKLKINVTAVVAACENLISADSYKPGDIVTTMAGKTLFIGNTDAEGRVTLVDSVYYTHKIEKATQIIDLATLTGAVISALGDLCSGSMTNNDEFLKEFMKSTALSGEYTWQLPLHEMYRENIKHSDADYVNTASGSPGTPGPAAGGLLIQEFVDDRDWIHMDIAGPAHLSKAKSYYAAGATGYGVKSLYEFAKAKSAK